MELSLLNGHEILKFINLLSNLKGSLVMFDFMNHITFFNGFNFYIKIPELSYHITFLL